MLKIYRQPTAVDGKYSKFLSLPALVFGSSSFSYAAEVQLCRRMRLLANSLRQILLTARRGFEKIAVLTRGGGSALARRARPGPIV